jgi:hypothetical protein
MRQKITINIKPIIMKQRLILLIISIALIQTISNAQERLAPSNILMTLYADNGISEIKITDNIDVVLIQGTDENENVSVKGVENTFSLINLEVQGETLVISPKKELMGIQRAAVFITINELHRLTLLGNSFATSRGKLNSRRLQVTIYDNAKIQLGSKGRIEVDTPDNYQVLREKQYVSASALNKL